MINFVVCWTGRKWINIGKGWFAIGFGPARIIERVMFRKKYIYVYRKAA